MNNPKILAYVTAYNSPKSVQQCVEAINQQSYSVESIFIFDNSSELIITEDNFCHVFHAQQNLGIGEGLKHAYKFAIKNNYDFLWTFDQDSIPQSTCLEILLVYYAQLSQQYSVGIIAPAAIDRRNNSLVEGAVFCKDKFIGCNPPNNDLPYECDAPITSGSLISISAAQHIDDSGNYLFCADLFIDGIDFDYGLRFKKYGFHNFIVPQAILNHEFGNPKKVTFLTKEIMFHQYSALRYYYMCRNHTYLEIRNAQGFYYKITSSLYRIKRTVYIIINILLYESSEKFYKSWACLRGTYHGFWGKLGKLWVTD